MNATTPFYRSHTWPLGPLWATAALGLCLTAYRAEATSYYVNDGSTANDIYCTAEGLDSNDGLTPQSPVASLGTLLTRYTLGFSDTVYIDSGTYLCVSNTVIDSRHGGSWDGLLTLQGAGRTTVFDRGSQVKGSFCFENYANHIRFSGLTFTGADVGLYIDSSFCNHAEISGNTFFNNAGAALAVQPSANTSYGSFMISHNLIYDSGNGLYLEPHVAELGDAFKVVNNTVVVTNGVAVLLGGHPPNCQVCNNILVAAGGGMCLQTFLGNDLFYSDYNDLWAYNGGILGKANTNGISVMLATLADWQRFTQTNNGAARDTHSISRDPLFASAANKDFHLKSLGGRWQDAPGEWVMDADAHSPCIDLGDPYNFSGDLNLEPDPNGGRKNLGAYGGTTQASKTSPGRALVALAPDLGQNPGQSQPILWSASGEGWEVNATVHIDYSLNGGSDWRAITNAQWLSVANGAFDWTRPSETYTPNGCWVRIVSDADPLCSDAAYLPFASGTSSSSPTLFFVNDGSLVGDVWCTTAGSDANDGLTPATPMASIQAVIDRYHPSFGATLRVDAGTYLLASDLALPDTGAGGGGASPAWFCLIGAGRNTVLNRQSTASGTCCLRVYQDFTYIEGFVFKGADVGVTVYPSSCRNAKVVGCVFAGNSGCGLRIVPDTTSEGFDTYQIYNNLFYGAVNGLSLQAESGNHLATCYVKNNTVAVYGGVGIACGGRPSGTFLSNNIVSAKGSGFCLSVDAAGALYSSDYNDFYAFGGAGIARWSTSTAAVLSAALLPAWQSASGQDASSFGRDPLFVAPASGDFHLRSQGGSWHNGAWTADTATSPCIDAGNPSDAYDQEPANNGGRINMGAFGNTAEASKSAPRRALYLNSPRGGETWSGAQTIVWSSSGTGWNANDSVRIEISTDGSTWSVLSGSTSLAPSGSFTWILPVPTTGALNYTLRVVCNQDSTVYDITQGIVAVVRVPTTYFVNDSLTTGDLFCSAPGASTNTGKSADSPLPSLSDVLSRFALGPGDTVYVDAGDYSLTSNIVVGTAHGGSADAPIRIIGTRTGTYLNRQSIGSDRKCLEIHADYLRVEGLTCTLADTGIAVDASTARHVQLVANTCRNTTSWGIVVKPMGTKGGEEYQILQNVLFCNSGAGLYLQGSPNASDSRTVFVVENNTVLGPGNGVTLLNANSGGRRTNLLKNNLIHATGNQAACLVTLPGSLHYSDFNDLFPAGSSTSVGAWQSSTSGTTTFATLAQWRSANGQDAHSVSADEKFVSAVNGNLRLRPNSPCVDAGINSFWMFDETDADGNARISGKTCDIGAYEMNMKTSVRLFLEGPFQSALGLMNSALRPSLPMKSPYADDARTATNLPANVTDWVLVQFRQETNGPAVLSRSVLLRNDGWLVTDKGDVNLDIDLPPNGAYYLVVKHRNHLAAMSSVPLAFTNQSVFYDFTASSSAYFGGASGCVPVASGNANFWALRAGDVDGDGRVLPVDAAIYASQTNALGYRRADVDLDGVVSATDNNRILSHLNAASAIPRPDVALQPSLRIAPSRHTLTAGETVTLTGSGGETATTDPGGTVSNRLVSLDLTGEGTSASGRALNWAFVQNPSGGALQTTSGVQSVYSAGSITGATDVVEAWNSTGALGRAYLNVMTTQTVATVGKALVIAGRKSAEDTLWPTTDYLANNAYSTLRYRGFSKANLFYLSPDPDQDVDGNGEWDDIDGESTFANAAFAFTNSAAHSDNLFVYLVDHGGNSSGDGYFRLSATETITAAQLDAWLDALQDTYNTQVTVLLDFCYSGSFLHAMTYSGSAPRIVVAACGTNQPSYFVAGGLVSFSSTFFSGVLLGYNVGECFDLAQSSMSTYQAAMLDDNKDGTYTTNDYAVADNTYIGPTSVASGDAPVIGQVCGNQVLTSDTSATLWIGSVSSIYSITQAWCQIVPPGYDPNPDNPVTELPRLDLAYDESSGRYAVTYNGFTAPGTYSVQFYVQDEEGNVSAPRQAYVSQIGYDDRIVLVAGGNTNSASWSSVEYLAQLAYATLRLRLFTPDRIRVLSPAALDLDGDGTNDVAAAATVANLHDAIASWATTNSTDRLTLYLIGDGEANALRLNDSECLTTNELAEWVHTFQATNPVPVTVVMDFSGAGAFIPALGDADLAAEFPDATRIAIASSAAGGEALFGNGGTVSFSQYLFSGLAAGETLGDAYTAARRAIRRVSGSVRQRAQIDDTLNGVANEKNVDGLLADVTYLGSAFVTGADAPVIGQVIAPTVLPAPGTALTLWASEVAGMNAISNVWCVITPPDFDGTSVLPTYELAWNAASGRYELPYNGFLKAGTYELTFYAQDTLGELSDPAQSEVLLADAYEPDDTPEQASLYDGRPQLHNFHSATDADWIRFYLLPDFVYDFETYHHSTSLDTVLDLYRERPDGTLELLDHVDEEGSDMGEYTGMDYPERGWYWARITPYEGSTNAVIGTYEFSADIPAAGGLNTLIVLGLDDIASGALPTNSTATVTGQGSRTFGGSTTVTFSGLTNGTYLVTVPTPANFFPREDPTTPYQVQSLTNLYYANPRSVSLSGGGWRMAGFEMIPSIAATSGVVRDAWTHALLANAQIAFTATSGSLTGTVVDGSVILTSYRTNWVSAANGQFPASIVLGACNWNLSVSLAGYQTNTLANAVSNVAAGASVALGTTYLVPVDANSNGIADAWEALFFPGGTTPAADPDGDGLNNQQEYLCGTDPTNALSVLRFLDSSVETNTPTLTWSVVAGRSYQILAATSLVTFAAAATNGPWEAAYGQSTLQWSDTNAASYPARFYRVRLKTP